MNLGFLRRLLWVLVVVACIVAVDQLTKLQMIRILGPEAATHRHEVLGAAFAFEYIENTGAAFGIFAQNTTALIILSLGIMLVAFYLLVKVLPDDFLLAIAIALILGGAIGNAIDRIARGYVVDFIAVGRFWKFNLADTAITIGIALVVLLAFVSTDHAPEHIVERAHE